MILLVFFGLSLTEADARLAEIRAHFSVAALEALARDAPGTEAGGEAAAWRGALALAAHDPDGAGAWFALAESAPPGGEARRQSERGLGNLALLQRRYPSALAHYRAAAAGANPVLAEELSQKRALAGRLLVRQRFEWLAWIVWCGSFGYFAARAWRGRGPLRPPLEAIYVLPLYALLIAGAWGRDPLVARALGAAGALSLLSIAVAGLASRRAAPGPRLRWLQAALLVVANLALFYGVVNHSGLWETLKMTAQM